MPTPQLAHRTYFLEVSHASQGTTWVEGTSELHGGSKSHVPRYAYTAGVITAFVFVHAEPRAVAPLGQAIADIEGVREVYSTTGEADLIVVLWVRDHERIATVVTEEIAALDGIVSTRTSIAYRAYSTADRNLV